MSIIAFISWVLIAVGLLVIYANWAILIRYSVLKHRERGHSLFLLFGGSMTSLGMFLSGSPTLLEFFWLPLLLDLGCVPAFLLLLWRFLIRRDL